MASIGTPRIIQIVGSLGIGGAEQIGMAIAIGVRARGWDSLIVSVTSHRNQERNAHTLRGMGVGVEVLSEPWFRKMQDAANVGRRYHPDIVHVHTELPEVIGMVVKTAVPTAHLVRTVHNQVRWPDHGAMRRLAHWYYQQWAARQYACSPAAVWHNEPIILNGVPWAMDIPDKDSHLVSFVGRMESQKNPAGVIEIVRLARCHDSRIHLCMVGGGSLLPRLQSRYDEDWIEWVGPLYDATGHISRSRVVVFASTYEGLPLVAVEALTRLTAVVAPNITGFQGLDWVSRYSPWDWKEASQQLIGILEGCPAEGLAGARARYQSLYSQSRMVENYLSEYLHLLTRRQVSG